MAASALTIRTMSMTFRVFLTDRLGTQGVGLYQLVLSVYLVFAAVASTGVSLCATRVFSELCAQGHEGKARFSVERCMIFSFLLGTMLGALMLAGAVPISCYALHDKRAVSALMLLSPSLPFLAVSACVRGYFLARKKTLQTSGEQLIEQLIEMGTFIVLFSLYRPESLEQACMLTVAGTTGAEVLSFVYSLICYHADIKRTGIIPERTNGLMRHLMPVFLPVTANACLRCGLSAAENALIPLGLQHSGLSRTAALSQYGIICGMTLPVLTFPSVLVLPFAALIISEVTEERVCGHKAAVRRITEKMVSASLRYSIPVTVIFVFFGVPLCELLFKSSESGYFLSVLAPVIPFMYLDSVVDSILKGLNEQTSYFIFNTIDSVIRVLLTVVLLPFIGIYGVVVVIIVSELLNTLMSLMRLVKITDFRLRLLDDVFLPVICASIPCLLAKPISISGSKTADILIKLLFCCLIYLLLRAIILLVHRPSKTAPQIRRLFFHRIV